MKKLAIYPGSFNPWHEGHKDIFDKATKLFDIVIVARGVNPDKAKLNPKSWELEQQTNHDLYQKIRHPAIVTYYDTLLVDFIKEAKRRYKSEGEIVAVIRGLRNGSDLQYETNLQYWNEDLGLDIPVVYFVTDRKYCHISSSAIRQIEQFRPSQPTMGPQC